MYKDLREFIELVERLNALRRIDGADPRHEIGGITEIAAGRPELEVRVPLGNMYPSMYSTSCEVLY